MSDFPTCDHPVCVSARAELAQTEGAPTWEAIDADDAAIADATTLAEWDAACAADPVCADCGETLDADGECEFCPDPDREPSDRDSYSDRDRQGFTERDRQDLIDAGRGHLLW